MTSVASQEEPSELRVLVRLLGEPFLQRRGEVPVKLSRKDAALVAKLALDGPQPQPLLCGLLWPDGSAEQAAANLRSRSARLHKKAGTPVIELGSSVRLGAGLACDAVEPQGWSDELLLSAPTLLAGLDFGDLDELDRWVVLARTRMSERCAEAATGRAESLERAGQLHQALDFAAAIVKFLPLGEQGWRRLIRLHYLRGDRGQALETYWQLRDLLRDELGILPSVETQRLYQTVEASGAAPQGPRRPLPASLLRPPVLIGRHAAWSAMATAWKQPQPFLIVGEAGLGKTRLLDAFLHGQAGCVVERARPEDSESSDALFRRLLHRLCEQYPACGDPLDRNELARVLPELGTAPSTPPNQAVLRHSLERWLVAVIDAGLTGIVVDDLHNANVNFVRTIRWLSASPALAGLRWALASRPWGEDEAGAVLASWLTDSHRPVRIDLEALSREELSSLLASLALPELLDAQAATRLYRHAGGHPLYTLATLQHMIANGCGLAASSTLPATTSVQALLDARIRDLPSACRDLLAVAAVGGAELTVERAARLLGCSALALSEAWGLLEASDVLRGEAFSHDLAHEAALRAVPQGMQQSLHRRWAALLAAESAVPPALTAGHWEKGLRWSEAGHAWHAAAAQARLSGRLAEQTVLFEKAADCHARAGDAGARFEALLARLDGLHLRSGGVSVLDALSEIEPLADTAERRLRCRIVRTEALLDQGLADQAVGESSMALDRLGGDSLWAIDARAQHAIALAQIHRFDEALASATLAVDAARRCGDASRHLKAINALMYVHWSAGRMTDAIAAQGEELSMAEAIGDRALAAASEGSLASLLASAGNLKDAHAHATRAQRRQRDIGMSENSTQVILNHTVLGASAAALGRFDEALAALLQAVALAGSDASAAMRARARIALARVWLMLGRPDDARALAVEVGADAPPSLQMQAAFVSARAAQAEGLSSLGAWKQFDQLEAAHGELPLTWSVTFEASFNERSPIAPDRLARERDACTRMGLSGIARALLWREMMHWLQRPESAATAAAVTCAQVLREHADTGLGSKCYPPETWLGIAAAYERAGDSVACAQCLDAGRRWVRAALKRLAPEHRDTFMRRNPVNASLLAQDPAHEAR